MNRSRWLAWMVLVLIGMLGIAAVHFVAMEQNSIQAPGHATQG